VSGTEVIDEEYHCEVCCKCGVKWWMPLALHEVALIRREEFTIWCPNGHAQFYRTPEEDDDPDGEEDAEIVTFPIIQGGKR
jgi:hypothetical protein